MQFIDSHTHISDPAFLGEEEAVIERALQAGVYKMLLADISSKERGPMYELAAKHPGVLYPMLGFYPGNVDANWRDEVDLVYSLSATANFVAIGEIGLDYHWSKEFRKEQMEALEAQLQLAAKLDMPVNIHLRDATEDFFSVLDSCRGLGLRGNLHAFSGSAQTAKRIARYGDWYVGIGGVLTFKNAGIAKEIADIPLEMILLETDAPYLAPTPLRGSRNESANIPIIAQRLAELKHTDILTVAQTSCKNTLRLFSTISE